MGNKKLSAASVRDGVEYRTASKLSMALGVATNGGGMCFYLLMMYASYIANAGYGIAVAVAGIIITGTRIFDGITDPLVAFVFDRIKAGKHGKIRFFLIAAWCVMALACFMMYDWMSGKYTGVAGVAWFIGIYVVCLAISRRSLVLPLQQLVVCMLPNSEPRKQPLSGHGHVSACLL